MTTGSTVISVPQVILTRMTTLGTHRFGFPVLVYTLPAATSVAGLIGLDFLRGFILTVDFRSGRLDLT
jgi:hypothetical protein